MDQERERIQADLRGLVSGEVRCDDVFLQLYASDASLYEIRPLGIVRPRNTADVVACVQYAAENEIPVHARGAGTGLAGESLGPGLVIDFSYSMRRILQIGEETARVQPGVVHAHLNEQLAARGRIFGPDPATSIVTTMGSVIALDGAGSHHRKYGSARDHIEKLQLVLADGSVIEVGTHDFTPSTTEADQIESLDDVSIDADSRRARITRQIGNLLSRNQRLIDEHRPRTEVHRSGYRLDGIVSGGKINLAGLVAGSEGTLALITEATVRTQVLPRYKGIALLFFDRLEAAANGATEVRRLGADVCDLMDRRLLTLAQESDIHYELLIPRDAEAMLMVEQSGDSREAVYKSIQQIVDRLRRRKRLAFDARTAFEDDDIALFEQLTKQVVPRLYRLKASSRAVPFVEDFAVPPEALPDFLVRVQNVLKARQVTAAVFCHAMHGQIHIRPFLDISRPDDVALMQPLAEDLYREVVDAKGTISGEHGDGLSRTWFVGRQAGPLYPLMREVKRIFDPRTTFNPGKVIADAPQAVHERLRKVAANPAITSDDSGEASPGPLFELQLNWDAEELALAARNCNGCGRCRTTLDDSRMCPIFRLAPAEEASPRAKANLARGLLTGELSAESLGHEELKSIADLCVNCHQCRLECPASVNIPKLVAEAKGLYVARNGLRLDDRFLARLDRVVAWGSNFRSVSNWAISNRFARWMLERVFGIAQGRKLPRFAANTFIREAHRRRVTREARRTGRKVVYFVDTYANWFDPELGEALLDCLAHNGIVAYVPPEQLGSGMQLVQLGALERLRSIARKNIAMLADAVRQGYDVICTEPSAALCLKHEYPALIDHEDANLVAEHTHEACSYLWRMHQQGQLELDLRPVNVTLGYHQPCHSRALDPGSPGEHLLRLIPGVVVKRLEHGCSGMAGVFGLKRQNYRSSLRVGWGLISAMRQPQIHAGASECSSCKMQMEQGVTKPTVHPLKMLALAYGLRPEFASLLNPSGEDLVVT